MFSCCRSSNAVVVEKERTNGDTRLDGIFAPEKQQQQQLPIDATSTSLTDDDALHVMSSEGVAVGCMRPGRRSNRKSGNHPETLIQNSNRLATAALTAADNDDNAKSTENTMNHQQHFPTDDDFIMRTEQSFPEEMEYPSHSTTTTTSTRFQKLAISTNLGDEDLNDNIDQGRNPPLYKPGGTGVEAKRQWLQHAFTPAGTPRFPDSPRQMPRTAPPTATIATAPSEDEEERPQELITPTTLHHNPAQRGGLVLPPRIGTTYKAEGPSRASPKPQLVTRGYRDCPNPEDEAAYETWYQKGLLRWRPKSFQPNDGESYQHMRNMARLGGSQSDMLQDPDMIVISPTSSETEQLENKLVAPETISPPQQQQPGDARPETSLFGPVADISNQPHHHHKKKNRPPPPITSLFSPEKQTVRRNATTPRNNSATHAPIVSLFGSPLPPRAVTERVAYFQNYVHSYKTYASNRTSPEAKAEQSDAYHELQQAKHSF